MNLSNKNIQNLSLYNPPLENRRNFDGYLLDFNERSCSLPKHILKKIKEELKETFLQIYPQYNELLSILANYCEKKKENILLCNGSDRGIEIVFRTFSQRAEKVIIPYPSFPILFQAAHTQNTEVIPTPYTIKKEGGKNSFCYPTEEVLHKLKTENIKIVTICSPNNPTGTLTPLEEVEQIIKQAMKSNTLVFIDEAYFDFCQTTSKNYIDQYPNIIISRTFSKAWGLAGLRLGYLMGSSTHIYETKKVISPYDVNSISVNILKTVLQTPEYMDDYVNEVMKKSKPLIESFFRENHISYFESSANFLLFKTKKIEKTYTLLRENKILVRPQKSIKNCIRLSIGTVKQMQRFIEIYKKHLL